MRSTSARSASSITALVPSTLARMISSGVGRPQPIVGRGVGQVSARRARLRPTRRGRRCLRSIATSVGRNIGARAQFSHQHAHPIAGRVRRIRNGRADKSACPGDKQEITGPRSLPSRNSRSQRSPPGGVALHPARIGGGAAATALARGGGEAPLAPIGVNLDDMTAAPQFLHRRLRQPALHHQDARPRGARPERDREMLGVPRGSSIASCRFIPA